MLGAIFCGMQGNSAIALYSSIPSSTYLLNDSLILDASESVG